MRILIAEDQHTLARNIQRYLQMNELYTVDVVFDGKAALQKAENTEYDCIILDVMMPKADGFAVCRQLRSDGCNTAILMLTAVSDKESTVKGLDCGADDYLTKPFELDELLARIRALLRRRQTDRQPLLSAHGVELNPNTKQARLNDDTLELAPKEYALLEFLLRNQDKALSRQEIIEHVWGESEEALFSQSLDVHIAYLRKKIGKSAITTVPGTGYMITSESC